MLERGSGLLSAAVPDDTERVSRIYGGSSNLAIRPLMETRAATTNGAVSSAVSPPIEADTVADPIQRVSQDVILELLPLQIHYVDSNNSHSYYYDLTVLKSSQYFFHEGFTHSGYPPCVNISSPQDLDC